MLRSGLTKYMNLIRIINFCYWITLLFLRYCKIPKISPRAYIFQRPFLRGLYSEGLIYGGKFAFQNRLGKPYSWKWIYRFCFVLLSIWVQFSKYKPPGAYIWRGYLTEGLFALPVWGACTWRGLFSEFYGTPLGKWFPSFFVLYMYKMSNQFGLSCSNGFLWFSEKDYL